MQKGDIPNELSPLGDEYGIFYCFFKIKSKVNENVDIRPWVYTIQHFFESKTARVKNAVHTYYAMKVLLHKRCRLPPVLSSGYSILSKDLKCKNGGGRSCGKRSGKIPAIL